ncbi:single stranded DNA-binding domain-containing protein [Bacillus norwichensis]|uniref:DUF4871 domain-containing protein n=1 Tax=Bacillus norwichensis TaxID=2762217 RepID=A0ABR8VFD1_9BACI|nr:hypothetical protein [Bacillus norwichensis]MBD8003488.1 hypothetical protein [Bacillus norwichensis]
MRETERIKESLKSLPKYSLSKEQRQNILSKLQQNRTHQGNRFKPAAAILFLSVILLILVFSLLEGGIGREIAQEESQSLQMKTSMEDKAESYTELESVSQGQSFILPDTKQEVFGLEGRVGILNPFDYFVAEDPRRVAKLMIFFWGNPEKLAGKEYEIEAANHNESLLLSKGVLSQQGLNGDDAHILTSFTPFPEEGLWQLSFYVDGQLFDKFSLKVLPPFPKSEHYTLEKSPKEMEIGNKTNITIESSGKDKEKIDVQLINENGKSVSEHIFVQETKQIDASTNSSIYIYGGKLSFPEKGIWKLKIDGEETGSFEN